MLSYLRDPNLAELPAEQQATDAPKHEQEYLTVATRRNAVRKSTTLLCVLFIIGLICLGVMIKKSAPKAAVAKTEDHEEKQIESAITRLTGIKSEMFNKMDEIMSKFYQFSDVFQVEVSHLRKNPFQLESFLESLKANSANKDSQIDAEMIYKERIKQKAKGMKLYSIMQSQKGTCCMIDNKILYEGDKIEDFEVKKISLDNVQLELDGVEITLTLSK
jgi:preprotein translocase subunit SecG